MLDANTKVEYNANASDAMFSRILQRLDTQDKTLESILEQTKKTNGRVNELEKHEFANKRIVVALSSVISIVISLVGIFCKH